MKSPHSSTTRERVLEFIKRHGPVSVKELTEDIGITPMAIRGHLSKLEKDELIMVDTVRQKLGRPLQVFRLTEKGESFFPKSYDSFAVELITDLQSLDDGQTLKKLGQKREERITQEILDFFQGETDPSRQLELYCEYVDQNGNMPKLTKLEEGFYRLEINNCPLSAVVAENSFCCDSEIRVLQNIFGKYKITRTEPLSAHESGCCYHFDFRD